MKHLALLAFMTLTACSSADQVSETKGAPAEKTPHALYAFEVDSRPVDGPYLKLTIKLDEMGTYTANMQTITPGDLLPVTDTTEEIGANLVCEEEKVLTQSKKLQKLYCMADNRPADGYLIELTVIRNADKLYDVILHKNAYSMIPGQPQFDETTEIAYGMTRLN